MADDTPSGAATSLETLLEKLQAAVENTQRIAEEQHRKQLEAYLEEDGSPRIRRVRVPDPRAHGWRELDVPLLALARLTSMQIKELAVEFNTSVASLLEETDGGEPSSPRESEIRLERSPPSGSGPATVRVVFAPAAADAPHRTDVAIRFLDRAAEEEA